MPTSPNLPFPALALGFEHDLMRYIRRFVKNETDAEDILQETYARLLGSSFDAVANPSGGRSFCFKVAHNIACDFLRARKRSPISAVPDVEQWEAFEDSGPRLEDLLTTEQEFARASKAVEQLSPRRRQIFVLRRVYGYSVKEIAEWLKIAEDTVNQHMVAATRDLAKILHRQLPGQYQASSQQISARAQVEKDGSR